MPYRKAHSILTECVVRRFAHPTLICLIFMFLHLSVAAQLRITGLVHGPLSGAPKALELYAEVDIEDLSTFGIGTANNGTGSAGVEWWFPAVSVDAGTLLTVSKESPVFAAFFGVEPDFVDNGAACNFNGDDAVELFYGSSVIDRFGDPDTDGTGMLWDYEYGWSYRNCADPGTNGFDIDFWEVVPGAMSGILTNEDADSPFPLGTYWIPCAPSIPGCTEPHADNYNPNATTDDSSCSYIQFFASGGCTYSGASNYDATALFDDGSCAFVASAACPSDLNQNGSVDVADLLMFLGAFGTTCTWEPVFTGSGIYTFNDDIPIHYFIPSSVTPDADIVMVFHGNNRNASEYRDSWIAQANAYNLIVLAPEFSASDFPGSAGYMQGGMYNENGEEQPMESWTFSLIDPMIVDFHNLFGSNDGLIDLWGHSAGGQFVHRFMLFKGSQWVDRAIAANSGWYTCTTADVAYPYGLLNAPAQGIGTAQAFSSNLTVSLGTADTLYSGPIHTPEADAQGLNRFERGGHFWNEAVEHHNSIGGPFNWSLFEVDGVGHTHQAMAAAAALFWFE